MANKVTAPARAAVGAGAVIVALLDAGGGGWRERSWAKAAYRDFTMVFCIEHPPKFSTTCDLF